jgi:hypothetical protein
MIAVLCLMTKVTGCSLAIEQYRKDSQMTQSDKTLWQAIDALAQQVPFTRTKVEAVLMTPLVEKDTSRSPFPNKAFRFYIAGRTVSLSDGVVISDVDLRIRHRAGHPGFLVLNLNGACIGLHKIRAHYEDIKLTFPPRPDSADPSTGYSVLLPWGKLSFGFLMRNPDCLSSLVFDPEPVEASDVAK